MENEPENDGLEFSEFLEELEEFEDELDFEGDDVETRTAILIKNNLIALLCLKTASGRRDLPYRSA